MKIRRPLFFVHQFTSMRAHVHVTAFHNESLGRRQFLTCEKGGQFCYANWFSFLLVFRKGACRATECLHPTVDHGDRARMRVNRSGAGVTLFSLRGAVCSKPGVPEAGSDQKRSEDGKPS